MDYKELNKLIERALTIKGYMDNVGSDPSLGRKLIGLTENIYHNYGNFLETKLFDVYDEYFEDDKQLPLLEYFWGEVKAMGDELGENHVLLSLKASPLRIEARTSTYSFHEILWELEESQLV